MANNLTIKYKYTGSKVTLTNQNGDTYTSRSEELIDFVLSSMGEENNPVKKIFNVDEVINLVNKYVLGEISMSSFVEIINEKVSGIPENLTTI